jgi:hypothetical protein
MLSDNVPLSAAAAANAGLDKLSAAIEAGEALQARVRESLQMRSPLESLQALADEAAGLPVYVPDVEDVHNLLGKARDWLRKANSLASQVCGCGATLGV